MSEAAPANPASTEDLAQWDTIIEPDRGWLDLRLREVWENRDHI